MPPSTNTRSQRTQNDDGESQEAQSASLPFPGAKFNDLVSTGYLMYPVFCTANIPPQILDEFVREAFEAHFYKKDDGDIGGSSCILTSTDLDSIVHGSREPMEAFESPFLGQSDDEVREWMQSHRHPALAQATFVILDEDTIKNKTCRVGDASDDADKRIVLSDFYCTIGLRLPIEVGLRLFEEEKMAGTGRIYNREYRDNMVREQHEAIKRLERENQIGH